ncbi:hypothetical protein EPA93_22205 [Ktedonosporobacter rubrisoli]|uniref:DUF485 domain-containing protein n=1 Tax=Ktedonosporobacter rubrisoli TaxID=2509675 RepID=A0A4P6JSN4_KTERU|nr:hypothetical protein [Ktedonosporobacter rubrisoli]QBD78559.1 hypothetical protein EPA93_22205 [Ktedonosporobacter rubrisoli]
MSQQEAKSQKIEPRKPSIANTDDETTLSDITDLQMQNFSRNGEPTRTQRFAVAVVSLVLLLIIFAVVMILIYDLPWWVTDSSFPFGIFFGLVSIFVAFSVAIIWINVVFNRRHS